jgi:molybdopterin molybdotransferase
MNVAVRTSALSGCDCTVASSKLIPVEQALANTFAGVAPISGSVMCPVAKASGRIAVMTINSAVPLPRFGNSAMDGYAIHADDIICDHPLRLRLTGRIAAGGGAAAALRPGTTVQILTGAPVPLGVAAVVPHEDTRTCGDLISIEKQAAPGDNIRCAGEDVMVGEPLVSGGTRVDARHIALLQAAGVSEIPVVPRVRVGLLSTGDELAEVVKGTHGHRIVDTNRPLLSNLLNTPDVEVRDFGIVADRTEAIAARMRKVATDCDLLVTTGGICGSDADQIAPAIRAAGGECRQIKLALKPGKPLGIGRLGRTHILSLPGNPVSALVTTLLFVRPLLRRLAGAAVQPLLGIPAVAVDAFPHATGRTEFVPVMVESVDAAGRRRVKSLPRESHRLSSLAAADGLAEIAGEKGDVASGEPLIFHSFGVGFCIPG